MFSIVAKEQLNNGVVKMTIAAEYIAKKAKAGQFVIFRVDEFGERVPLTVADTDPQAGTVTVIVQPVGRSTMLLVAKQVGDTIADFVGPLGKPTEFGTPKKAIVVGGGVGCAIALPQAKALHQMGAAVDVIAGFRNKEVVILEKEFSAVCQNLHITTDDGSYGQKGFVTDVLKSLLEKDTYDIVIAIGPIPMMKFVSEVTRPYGVKTIVSLNPIMIDGTGMCGGCRVTVGGQTKFACVDGPDFDGHLVDFDELQRRNTFYKGQESHDRDHTCRMEGMLRG